MSNKKKALKNATDSEKPTCDGFCSFCSRICEKPTAWAGTISFTASAPTDAERLGKVEIEQGYLRARQNVTAFALVLMAILYVLLAVVK